MKYYIHKKGLRILYTLGSCPVHTHTHYTMDTCAELTWALQMYVILRNSTSLFRRTDEWLGPPCQPTNMRYTLDEVSFFPFNSDRKESEML